MIYDFARFSDIRGYPAFPSDSAVRRFMEDRGDDFDAIVEECRDPARAAPFENRLVGGFGTVRTGSGGSVSIEDTATGEELAVLKEDGVLVDSVYQHQFYTAVAALTRVVENTSLADLESAIVHGIASIEGYLNYRAGRWNRSHPEAQLVDSKESKVTFEEKVRQWIPVMARGQTLDLGDERWRNFLTLQSLRDHWTIHPKQSARAMPFREIATYANMFRAGIAGLLMAMHKLFGERIPSQIIRAHYAAEVEVVDE
ncbi:MAG TPA: hypothetical protein VGJ78_14760 [Vicinamibacterales bacterium]|jgi:hypothetical protein